jgi:hypothetical protein
MERLEPVVFKVTVKSEFFGLPTQLGLKPTTHTSEALAERYRYPRQLIIQTVHILQLDSAVIRFTAQWECCKAIPSLLSNDLAQQ